MVQSESEGATRAAEDSSGDTRQRILQSALQTFAAQGFDGTTTRQIADHAGVNLGLLQYHFGGKEKLWRAAVDLAFSRLKSGLVAIKHDETVVDDLQRIRLLIRDHVRFVAHNPEFVRIMHDVGKRPGPRMEWLVDTHVRPLYEGIEALLERAGHRMRLPDDVPPIHFHYVLAGAVSLIFHQSEECLRLSGVDAFDPETIETHARVVEHFLIGPNPEPTAS